MRDHGCWLSQFSERECDGWYPQRAHLISKQQLRNRLKLRGDEVWEPALWVISCAAHHHAFDHGFLPVPKDKAPDDFVEWVRDHGAEHVFDGDFRWETEL